MTFNKKLILAIAAILTLVVFVSGCTDTGTTGEDVGTDVNTDSASGEVTTITVSAAASLTEAFTELWTVFEEENPDIKVSYNFAGSGSLRMQIEAGAPIDVFASASQSHMNILSNESLIVEESRKDFASNTVVLITPADSELNITGPEDLLSDNVDKISVGNPDTAPVGKYTIEALEEAGLWDELKSKNVPAENVKQILVYTEIGEVDAGFVYSTDAATADEGTIEVKATVPTVTPISYPIAVVASSEHQTEAQTFVDFVTSDEGRTILQSYGFTA
ncbi:molybdate ABC transporter substrate-binding protein [Methanolobus sediminis]|uniref:Molybdate ABC transporter substrate-binding protein n=1 Tax=Methanolobus sediminis TaxID=3072978 RepID=A0AA51YN32_9EURY|nr:molybdate ABC transporter substrate-binding protein [Methanolobus sediminis]WMW26218.1 molybdate ABC transporter substrate-binding protein [Methanolobus sediminis]